MNKIKLNLIIKLVYFAVLQNIAFTQQNTTIEIKYENTSKQQVINSRDTNEVLFATNKIIHQLQSENYFTAAVDSINNSKILFIFLVVDSLQQKQFDIEQISQIVQF